jgi:hypothetical protein
MEIHETCDGTAFGGLFQERKHLRSDLGLVKRAVAQGWKIPPATWAVVMKQLERIMADDMDQTNMRAIVVAMELIFAAHRAQVEAAIAEFNRQIVLASH